jgi:hypothetical protein
MRLAAVGASSCGAEAGIDEREVERDEANTIVPAIGAGGW